jgi:hypothetical protein
MTRPTTTGNGTPSRRPLASHAASNATSNASLAQINRTLHLLRQVPAPNGLHERIEARLSAARLSAMRRKVVRISAATSDEGRRNTEGGSSSSWIRVRMAACALAVAAASLGLVADRSADVRALPPMPAAIVHVTHTGLEAAAAIRVPTHTVGPGKLLTGRSGHPLRSGRNTITQRTVLPQGVAVPNHPGAVPDATDAERDTSH